MVVVELNQENENFVQEEYKAADSDLDRKLDNENFDADEQINMLGEMMSEGDDNDEIHDAIGIVGGYEQEDDDDDYGEHLQGSIEYNNQLE